MSRTVGSCLPVGLGWSKLVGFGDWGAGQAELFVELYLTTRLSTLVFLTIGGGKNENRVVG